MESAEQAQAYTLFRQEKALDTRDLPVEDQLATPEHEDEATATLTLTSISDVTGVNALAEGGSIEPHEGLTILFGENGTGKTGYSRIFKALAASRSADEILGNIEVTEPKSPSARVGYTLGSQSTTYTWSGQQGVSPFTRMSIFDSPAVSFHVDDDLEYVYVPTALALFNYVSSGIKAVKSQIDKDIHDLQSGSSEILSRFQRGTTVHPLIESLGATTDLEQLKAMADTDPNIGDRINNLRHTVASLEADTVSANIKIQQRVERALSQASTAATTLADFDVESYQRELATLTGLEADYNTFRATLFAEAGLPAEPDETWSSFIESGEAYRQHLASLGSHDANRCLYCQQPLSSTAQSLISKYSEYLEDRITTDIADTKDRIDLLTEPIVSVEVAEASTFANENAETDDKQPFHVEIERTLATIANLTEKIRSKSSIEKDLTKNASADAAALASTLETTTRYLVELKQLAATRAETLSNKKKELAELESAAELTRSWPLIESYVRDTKQADRLTAFAKPIPGISRHVTNLAKSASDQMINENFDVLFAEECKMLRAPALDVEFVGRQGRAQRRKVLSGQHKPSKVLSEGEQKVLAIADFLAEARLIGITAPVIFDDPVSSLDHRRVDEVAQRVADLAETNQVIVFTHDILFATTLLSYMDKTNRCSYFQITDEGGKGQITRATGPRWDSLKNIKKKINETIEAAKSQQGDARAALVRTGYSWLRSWCEVFTETELLQNVTQRYQPNVRMTNLPKIQADKLPAAVDTINRIFEESCRYIDGHSQPLPTLGVGPTLTTLEEHWAELIQVQTAHNAASN